MEMFVYNLLQIVSLGLSAGAMYLMMRLLKAWHASAVDAWHKPAHERVNSHWIILGVWVSFVGQLADIIYWTIAWTAHLIAPESGFRELMFYYGTIPNIFFRQGAGIVAAFCHLFAAETTIKEIPKEKVDMLEQKPQVKATLKTATIIAITTVVVLSFVKFVVL